MQPAAVHGRAGRPDARGPAGVLRRLDDFGVVRPTRSSGGQRRYSRTEITIVRYVAQLAGEGMTLAAIRRVLELEDQVRALQAERDALLTALAERDELLAALTSRRRPNPALQGRRAATPRPWIRGSAHAASDGSGDPPHAQLPSSWRERTPS